MPTSITRVGMRYINRIARQRANEVPGRWIVPNEVIPEAILSSGPGFISRMEKRLNEHNRLLVTLAHDASLDSEPFGSLIFDIDRVREEEIRPGSLGSVVQQLHEDIWVVFESAKSPHYDRLLNQEVSTNAEAHT
jgi:uncharacterized protein (TIGR04255 family)